MRKTTALMAATTVAAGIALPTVASAATPDPAAATVTQAATTTALATGTVPTTIPDFDYSDCPQLPAGVDPAKWRCEVLVAEGTVTISGTPVPFRFDAVTHAEGLMPDGTDGQVFGAFRASKLPVPGRQSGDGHGAKLWMQPRLTSVPDFFSNGGMNLAFELSGPGLGGRCAIGTDATPVQVVAARVEGTTQRLSEDPPIIGFGLRDEVLTMPETDGCGRAAEKLNRRFGLPSPSGANQLDGTAFYSFKTYDQL
ncbi:MAG: hypothetical protein HOW97_07325 [Catenulispora sp.]|nr:hypothetical protein [Catenulispora sp.]